MSFFFSLWYCVAFSGRLGKGAKAMPSKGKGSNESPKFKDYNSLLRCYNKFLQNIRQQHQREQRKGVEQSFSFFFALTALSVADFFLFFFCAFSPIRLKQAKVSPIRNEKWVKAPTSECCRPCERRKKLLRAACLCAPWKAVSMFASQKRPTSCAWRRLMEQQSGSAPFRK